MRQGLREHYYFSEKLMNRLAGASCHPVTVVEAPSGFGKTTAVREFLRRNGGDARQSWYTCFGEQPRKAWERICRLFDGVDLEAAAELRSCYPHSFDDIARLSEVVKNCRCEGETYLVVDNFQLFDNELSGRLPLAFTASSTENLHVIFITQPLPSPEFTDHADILRLGTRDFFFDRESTARLCRLKGARMSERELDRVQSVTEGWVSAILLQASVHKETGALADVRDMDSLVSTAVWNRLDESERDLLASLTLLESFTIDQATLISGEPELHEGLKRLISDGFFIQYVSDKGVFSIHAVLGGYLEQRFQNRPRDFIAVMKRRAGEACAMNGDYLKAAELYSDSGDYEKALLLPLTSRYLNDQKERDMVLVLEKVFRGCPEETLLRHPFALLTFAFQFMKTGNAFLFSRSLSLLAVVLSSSASVMTGAEMSRLRGEFALLRSFTEFNDIRGMSEQHQEAARFLRTADDCGESRTVVFGTTPWTFGVSSVLCLYWRRSGKLDSEIEQMDDCLPVYLKLSGGHGCGANHAMRAEAHLMRGEEDMAEGEALKALHSARNSDQTSIALCAELLLARLKLLRGDGAAYRTALENIKKYRRGTERSIIRMIDLCTATLGLLSGGDDLPEWLMDADGIRKVLYVQGQPCGLIIYAKALFLNKRYPELYGLTESMMESQGAARFLMPVLYRRILFAAAKAEEDKKEEALEYLRRALDIALPDRVYLPFAEFGATLLPLLEKAGALYEKGEISRLTALCRKFEKGATAVKTYMEPQRKGLTPREREIALLAKEGLKTREIAARLFVSENTVKTALKKIFAKLKVRSKNDLARMDF